MSSNTDDFYNTQADHYFQETKSLSMSELLKKLAGLLPSGGSVLDAGCGSGRDSRELIRLGFEVTAIDRSEELCRLASEFIGQQVECKSFQDIEWEDKFDGIWTCASLLHVSRAELPDVFTKMIRALKPGGLWYMSFKYGDKDIIDSKGRSFTNFTTKTLESFLSEYPFSEVELWEVESELRGNPQVWVNALVRK